MLSLHQPVVGVVAALKRYPVKSMLGEELSAASVTANGLLGDRVYAVLDKIDGKVVSAKNFRKWPTMFYCRAEFVSPPQADAPMPPIRLTLPDGSRLVSDQPDFQAAFATAMGRESKLLASATNQSVGVPVNMTPAWEAPSEGYDAGEDGQAIMAGTSEFTLREGSFFDSALVHLLTTATLDHLHTFYPQGNFEVPRFRPNIVIDTPGSGFIENGWVGCRLALGDEVVLHIDRGCPRCVMPTLPQAQLPKDPGILRTAVQQNSGNVGVYASVVRGGTVRSGDQIRLVD